MADHRVRRAFDRAAPTYDAAADVQRQTLAALCAALPNLPPAPRVIDVGCGTGLAFDALERRYPGLHLLGIDFAPAMLQVAKRRGPFAGGSIALAAGDACHLPVADASADLVFSSMTWQWCALPATLAEARRVLRPGGSLAFSTLIAGTFAELATAFAGIDGHAHQLELLSAAGVMGAVEAAGWRDIRSVAATRIARHDSPALALRSIRATGASEVGGARRPGLLGKAAWRTIEHRWRALGGADGRLPLTYQVLEVVAAR
jgi:malonyl-CoA O-methyltransferase